MPMYLLKIIKNKTITISNDSLSIIQTKFDFAFSKNSTQR